MKVQLSAHFTYRKLFMFVIPSIAMMIFTSIYGVIDGLFVSNFVGDTAFASINFVMPFIMILGGFGFIIGTGGSALVTKEIGKGNRDYANQLFSMLIIFTIISGAIIGFLGFVFLKPILTLLGATSEMMDDCLTYGRIIIILSVAFMLQNVFQSFLAAAEKPQLGLFITIGAGIVNIIFDALFIVVFNMNVAGAALATVLGQLFGGFVPFVYFIRPNKSLLKLTKTKFEFIPLLKTFTNGSSEFINNVSSSILGMVYNFQLLHYYGKNGVSAYGVIMYVQFIFIAVFIGYSIGTSPIIGYNYGAGNKKEINNILKKSLLMTSIGGIILCSLAILLSRTVSTLFVGYNQELTDLSIYAFRLFSLAFIFAGANIFISGFFTALNNGYVSGIVSFLRTLVFQMICIMVLPILIGKEGIWISQVIAEVLSLTVSVILLFVYSKKYKYFKYKYS